MRLYNQQTGTSPTIIHGSGSGNSGQLFHTIVNDFISNASMIQMHHDVHIVTTNTDYTPSLLEKCMDKIGVPITVLGQGTEDWKNYYKLHLLLNHSFTVSERFIMWLDARDVVPLDLNMAISVYMTRFKGRCIVNAQPTFWPDEANSYDRVFQNQLPYVSDWRYLNSGCGIAPVSLFQEIMQTAIVSQCDNSSDQQRLHTVFPRFYPYMDIDRGCEIFQVISGDVSFDSPLRLEQ